MQTSGATTRLLPAAAQAEGIGFEHELRSGWAPRKYPPAVGYQTGVWTMRQGTRASVRFRLEKSRALAVKTDGSLMPFQARPAVWFWTPCSIQ